MQTRGPGPRLWLTAPRSAFTARSGSSPPLGRFHFRFPADSVEENESGGVQQPAYQPSGRGAQGTGGGPGASELRPQPAPGEVSAALSWSPRGLLLADRAGGTPGGRWARAGLAGGSCGGAGRA